MATDTVSSSYEKGRVVVGNNFPVVWCKKELFFTLFPNHRNYQGRLLRRMLTPHFEVLGIESEDQFKSFRLFSIEQSQTITKIISGLSA